MRKKPVRKKLTEEQKRIRNDKVRATKLARYGDPNYNNMQKNRQTKQERYGDPYYNNMDKNKQTCLDRYGYEYHNQNSEIAAKISATKLTEETQSKYEQTMIERYGVAHPSLSPEIRAKYTATLLKNHGVTNPLKSKEIYEKHIQTMKKNNSYIVSKFEEAKYEELCLEYGKDDVIRQYKDDRYPFNCDFYIKSKDLFVEVNKHPSHGSHPFNPEDIEDILLLEKLVEENSDWSNMIIDVWTIRDVKKQKYAKDNNLNYLALY